MFNIRISGGKLTERKLKAMGTRVAGRAMRDELKNAMKPVETLAKARAPVGETGNLRKYIKTGARGGARKIEAFVQTGTRRQLKIPATSKYYYPAGIEYGTRKIPARSFLRSALGSKKNSVLRQVSRATVRALMAGRR